MAEQPWLPATWDRQADVVVVGFGAAGAATAITAYEAGAQVILLEKAPYGHEGGNTRVAGQGYLNTQGGPRRNARAQIVRPDGSPIPRLYSAGELGSIYSYLYQGTGNIGECLAFGRIAGRNAAAAQPWC